MELQDIEDKPVEEDDLIYPADRVDVSVDADEDQFLDEDDEEVDGLLAEESVPDTESPANQDAGEKEFEQLRGNPAFEKYLQKRMMEEQGNNQRKGQSTNQRKSKPVMPTTLRTPRTPVKQIQGIRIQSEVHKPDTPRTSRRIIDDSIPSTSHDDGPHMDQARSKAERMILEAE